MKKIEKIVAWIAIIVGSFMIRGTMHMWDKDDDTKNKESKKDDSKNTD